MRGSRIEVVLGTAQFAPEHCQGPRPKLSDGRGVGALLNAADSVGVAALDTAPARGDAESAIGDARCATPVHTKIDPALNPPSSLECSLGRMGALLERGPSEKLSAGFRRCIGRECWKVGDQCPAGPSCA